MAAYENMKRAGVPDIWVSCPVGTEELGPAVIPTDGAGYFEPVRLDVMAASAPGEMIIETAGILPFRQDYWNTKREDLQQSIAIWLTERYPDRSTEDILAAARKFTQASGTFVGAYRRGFLNGSAGIEFRTDGFTFPMVLKHPREAEL